MRGVLPFGFLGWGFGKGADKVVQIKNNYDKDKLTPDKESFNRLDNSAMLSFSVPEFMWLLPAAETNQLYSYTCGTSASSKVCLAPTKNGY